MALFLSRAAALAQDHEPPPLGSKAGCRYLPYGPLKVRADGSSQ